MKKLALAAALIIALLLPAISMAEDNMVTVTYPAGTIVQMSVETYQSLFLGGASTGAGDTADTQEQAVPWPTYVLNEVPLEPVIKWEAYRIMAYLGPSRNYAETDSYKPYKFSHTYGLFIEGSYVFVDMNYPSVGVRRTYFTRGAFESTSDVPEITLIGYHAETTESVLPRYGPGAIYDPFPDASVAAGTPLTIYFEESGYVFAEFEAGFQLVRAWIEAGSVTPE